MVYIAAWYCVRRGARWGSALRAADRTGASGCCSSAADPTCCHRCCWMARCRSPTRPAAPRRTLSDMSTRCEPRAMPRRSRPPSGTRIPVRWPGQSDNLRLSRCETKPDRSCRPLPAIRPEQPPSRLSRGLDGRSGARPRAGLLGGARGALTGVAPQVGAGCPNGGRHLGRVPGQRRSAISNRHRSGRTGFQMQLPLAQVPVQARVRPVPGLRKQRGRPGGARAASVGIGMARQPARAGRPGETAGGAPAAAVDPARAAAEQQKRAQRRDQRVRAGIDDLERWLEDVARAGLTDLAGRPRAYFDHMAARLVDAQAPGLARRVRWLSVLPHTGSRWPERMLIELGRLELLLEAYRRIDTLDDRLRADVRTQVGFADSREDILAGPAVSDTWSVLSRRVVGEERLRVQRTWLWGADSGGWVLVLDFAAGPQQSLDQTLVPGTRVEAEACLYPGASPTRALLKGPPRIAGVVKAVPASSIELALRSYAEALARNPWLERFPMAVGPVIPRRSAQDSWCLVDDAAARVPIEGPAGWHLLALSGGHPISVFGEWDGFSLWPLAALVEHGFAPLTVAAA